jgi:ABC-2 type transport system permease protein
MSMEDNQDNAKGRLYGSPTAHALTKGNQLSKHLQLIAAYFRFNLAAAMEYRGSFLLQVFGMALNNAAFLIFWSVLFTKMNRIGGYDFQDVMFIWALSATAFGLVHIFFGNVGQLSRMIYQGELDAYLLQPKDVYVNILASRTVVSAWGDLAYGVILYLIAFGFHPGPFTLFCLFSFFGGLLMGSVIFGAETLTFFVGNASALGRMFFNFLITFTLYPEGIYRGVVHWLIYSLIPAGFIAFLPLRIMKVFSWPWLGLLIAIDLAYVAGSYFLFKLGLKRYESGNLVVSKL